MSTASPLFPRPPPRGRRTKACQARCPDRQGPHRPRGAPRRLRARGRRRGVRRRRVPGAYDHVEQVLGALDMPFTAVAPDQLPRVRLRPAQLLVVNCPGNSARTLDICGRGFVASGGSLFTTDWASAT